ncbi:hypothetical protein [Leptospira noguchii]|uniref:hypothetical protein n=1 Tax=Leptospira noguchii TaxID=28182 RepID=UPI001FB5A127|nr:hypothetical protein [Leptospira noguchii]UOG48259.1 hypothetical protein MAL00_14750 [Leptospira noguchii]
MNELKHNAFLNSASRSLNSMHRFLRVALQVARQVALWSQVIEIKEIECIAVTQ